VLLTNRVPITIRLESFEGPLDLLLYLIQSHELDISRISIGKITDQYLSYVRLLQELNFDVASEFLVMAATLLLWKSKAILPQDPSQTAGDGSGDGLDGDGALSQEELIRQLLDHQRFREAARELSQGPRLGEDVFTRPASATKIAGERVWREMEVTSLALAYQDMLARQRRRTTVLKKETVSLTDKIVQFREKLELGKPREMRSLMPPRPSRTEIVATFLASLELSRLRKLRLLQEEAYREIYLELLESLETFNFELASGFETVAEAAQAVPPAEAAPLATAQAP
jgi:segregation and condensation protein A